MACQYRVPSDLFAAAHVCSSVSPLVFCRGTTSLSLAWFDHNNSVSFFVSVCFTHGRIARVIGFGSFAAFWQSRMLHARSEGSIDRAILVPLIYILGIYTTVYMCVVCLVLRTWQSTQHARLDSSVSFRCIARCVRRPCSFCVLLETRLIPPLSRLCTRPTSACLWERRRSGQIARTLRLPSWSSWWSSYTTRRVLRWIGGRGG